MFYQVLVHQKFLDEKIYNVSMEHDRSLIQNSLIYKKNKMLINEYIELENYFTNIFSMVAQVTKLVKDNTEQIVQIQCDKGDEYIFLTDQNFSRFTELRNIIGVKVLRCWYDDLVLVTENKLSTYQTFDEANNDFQRWKNSAGIL